jgi:peptidoglycan hydrolase CwlO-like protein
MRTVTQQMNRLAKLADMIEGVEARLSSMQAERDELITDLLLSEAGSGTEIGKLANVSQPRTSQIKLQVLANRKAAEDEMIAAAQEAEAQAKRDQRNADRRRRRAEAKATAASLVAA